MKKLLGKVFGKTSIKVPKIEKIEECKHHNHQKFPHIKPNEFCLDCAIKICYMCGNQHMDRKCTVNWGKSEEFAKFNHIEKGNPKLQDYNKGFLSTLNLEGLKCVCGEKIHFNGKGGICVACSNVVCSKECHNKYIEETKSCMFHSNFTQDLSGASMISILFKNVKNMYENPISAGMRLNKTSSCFVKGFTTSQQNQIYLQRGYRQYGEPAEETLRNLEVLPNINLDFVLHKNRKCQCTCMGCILRTNHPVNNCSFECRHSDELSVAELFHRNDFHEECDCNCPFCKSGITIHTHKKEDCFYYCFKNNLKNQEF